MKKYVADINPRSVKNSISVLSSDIYKLALDGISDEFIVQWPVLSARATDVLSSDIFLNR